MSASSYEAALKHLLVHEGGYTNHPSDPGGPTNFGITIFDYRLAFLQSLKTWPVFGKGWGRRVAEVRAAALAMAAAPRARVAPKVAAGGVIVAGAVAAQQAQVAGVDARLVVAFILIALGFAFLASLAWRRWSKQKEETHELG